MIKEQQYTAVNMVDTSKITNEMRIEYIISLILIGYGISLIIKESLNPSNIYLVPYLFDLAVASFTIRESLDNIKSIFNEVEFDYRLHISKMLQ